MSLFPAPPAHLVADPSGEELHELRSLEALNVPVLNGVSTQKIIQLGGQHGTSYLLISRRFFTWNKGVEHRSLKSMFFLYKNSVYL